MTNADLEARISALEAAIERPNAQATGVATGPGASVDGDRLGALAREEVDAGTSGRVYRHLKELTATGWLVSPKRGVFLVPGSRVVPLLTVLLAAGTPSG